MDSEHEDLDEDIKRLQIILGDNNADEGDESDGELRVLDEADERSREPDQSRPGTSSDVTGSSLPTTSMCTDDDGLVRFDPSTITAETCLAMNRAYQEVLLDNLRQVEISLAENRAKQREKEREIEEVSADKPVKSKYLSLVKFAAPYFKDSNGGSPPINEDVRMKETLHEDKQNVRPKPIWKKVQRKCLVNAVKMDALEQQVKPLLSRLEVETSKAINCKNAEEIEASKARIDEITAEINAKKQTPAEELFRSMDDSKIDFMKISVVNFHGKFDAVDCECMWRNVLKPTINKEKWSEAEAEKLAELVAKYSMRNWKAVAEELGTNRTPFQCLQYYQKTNFTYDQSDWTEAEDELLREVVETCRYGTGKVLWPQVAYYIDRRSGKQCEQRWGVIDDQQKRGKWNDLEDMLLLAAVQTLGASCDWSVVQEFVPGRTAQQCKERYINVLNDSLNFDEFTYNEDKTILNGHKDDVSWTMIASTLNGRTDTMVMNRYIKLMRWKDLTEHFFKQPVQVQKKMVLGAFEVSPQGGFVLRDIKGLSARRGVGRPRGSTKKKITEMQKLKQGASKLMGAEDFYLDKDGNTVLIKKEPVDSDNETTVPDADDAGPSTSALETGDGDANEDKFGADTMVELQVNLDQFLKKTGITAEDYSRQLRDVEKGDEPVPRPPPLEKQSLRSFCKLMERRHELENVVQRQIDFYVKKSKASELDRREASIALQGLAVLSKQKELDDDGAILSALGQWRPGDLTVRELLTLSRRVGRRVRRRAKRRKSVATKPGVVVKEEDGQAFIDLDNESEENDDEGSTSESDMSTAPWEEDDSSDEEKSKPSATKRTSNVKSEFDKGDDSSDDEFWSRLEEEARKEEEKKKKRVVRRHRSEETSQNVRKLWSMHNKLKKQLLRVIVHKIQTGNGGRRKRYIMYPAWKLIKSRERNLEDLKMDRKSLVLLMKTLDVNSMNVYKKAVTSKGCQSALAMLRSTDKIKRTRSQTAALPRVIARASNDSEAAEYVMSMKEELNICDEDLVEEIEDDEAEDAPPQESYEKCLPYIPPNKTNLNGMKMLVLDHRCLIDQAGLYFDPAELKSQLHNQKESGPNPLMNVLNALGKCEEVLKTKRKKVDHPELHHLKKEDLRAETSRKMDHIRDTFAYKKLMARFQSVFSWPALMSTIAPPKGQQPPKALIQQAKATAEADAKATKKKVPICEPENRVPIKQTTGGPKKGSSTTSVVPMEKNVSINVMQSQYPPTSDPNNYVRYSSQQIASNDLPGPSGVQTTGNRSTVVQHRALGHRGMRLPITVAENSGSGDAVVEAPPSKSVFHLVKAKQEPVKLPCLNPVPRPKRYYVPKPSYSITVVKKEPEWSQNGDRVTPGSAGSGQLDIEDEIMKVLAESKRKQGRSDQSKFVGLPVDKQTEKGITVVGNVVDHSESAMGHLVENMEMYSQDSADGSVYVDSDDITTANDDITEPCGGEYTETDDVITGSKVENEADSDLDNLPEEEAIERLVEKIIQEYKASGSDKQRKQRRKGIGVGKNPAKNYKKAQGQVLRQRTMVLKKLGLYEKMKEYERQKKARQQSNGQGTSGEATGSKQMTDSEQRETTQSKNSTETPILDTQDIDTNVTSQGQGEKQQNAVSLTEKDAVSSNLQQREATLSDHSGEGTDGGVSSLVDNLKMEPEDADAEPRTVKRKRGRQAGAKLTCYSSKKSPVRKSTRAADREPVVITTQKERKPMVIVHRRLRQMLPEKMSDLVSKISEVPILNTPIPEPPPKPPKPATTPETAKRTNTETMDSDAPPAKKPRPKRLKPFFQSTTIVMDSDHDGGTDGSKEPTTSGNSQKPLKRGRPKTRVSKAEFERLIKFEKKLDAPEKFTRTQCPSVATKLTAHKLNRKGKPPKWVDKKTNPYVEELVEKITAKKKLEAQLQASLQKPSKGKKVLNTKTGKKSKAPETVSSLSDMDVSATEYSGNNVKSETYSVPSSALPAISPTKQTTNTVGQAGTTEMKTSLDVTQSSQSSQVVLKTKNEPPSLSTFTQQTPKGHTAIMPALGNTLNILGNKGVPNLQNAQQLASKFTQQPNIDNTQVISAQVQTQNTSSSQGVPNSQNPQLAMPDLLQQMPNLLNTMMTSVSPQGQGNLGQGQSSQGQKSMAPVILPIPVTIGGTQQVALLPVYANSAGKYVLPNGQELDFGTSLSSGNSSTPLMAASFTASNAANSSNADKN